MYRAAVLGASGNVGKEVVKYLNEIPECSKITLVNRRVLPEFSNMEKVEQHVVDMDKLHEQSLPLLEGVDAVVVTMGVGAPSKVSKEELERVDVTLPTEFAKAAKQAGVRHLSILTSTGSDINSKPCKLTGTMAGGGLYAHLKGLIEENIKSLGFESVGLFKPATILGNENTPGLADWLAPKLDFIVPANMHSTHKSDLGRVMALYTRKAVTERGPPVQIFEGDSLQAFVKSK
eukprot:NODE_6870_length_834_cov_30.637131_g6270_i0.p1 GENE.NODE_6870_length_834_cov_30.637131_g6270_i0~~NODE_6870_length_834_cov_30.637131_g6270_i0.p1  ORF type:complete len:233 (-),score=69.17 NODE_6870_length_834_cov_30.637131_g6270_i0:83-781(-)